MRKMRVAVILALVLAMVLVGACSAESATKKDSKIYPITREDGSGTRSAFIELFGVQEKNEEGKNIDKTVVSAEVTNSTSVMMTSVASDVDAIGYISMGSLNELVKAIAIDGVAPSVETVKDGTYTISRPFNIVTKGEIEPAAQDFINYIISSEGQALVESRGYIKLDDASPFTSTMPKGRLVVAGSSSVTPLMEKLIEAYEAINSGVEFELQESDSTTGVNSIIDGISQIGMASRSLKSSEVEKGVSEITIAIDGIVVIVSNDNPIQSLTKDQVKGIYTGEFLMWSQVK